MSSVIQPQIHFADRYRELTPADFLVNDMRPGTRDAALLHVVQPAGRYDTPATDDMVLGYVRGAGIVAKMDFGAGCFHFTTNAAPLFLSPASTQSRVDAAHQHDALLLAIPNQVVSDVLEPMGAQGTARLHRLFSHGFSDDIVIGQLRQLEQIRSGTTIDDALAADVAVATILVRLAEIDGQRPPMRLAVGGLAPFQLRRAQEMLAANPGGTVGLGEVAAATGLSRYHFLRAFKHSTGITPMQWRLRAKMETAFILLSDRQRTIATTASALGYNNVLAFARAFHRVYGTTPSAFRRDRILG